jgi:hypothetical protein
MVRIAKQAERRSVTRKRTKNPSPKTGARKEKVAFKAHPNAVDGDVGRSMFIPKIK